MTWHYLSLALTVITTFDEAKVLADKQEDSLPAAQTSELLDSQGRLAGRAFATCMPSPPPKVLPNFTIVMLLDASGGVKQTWREGDSDFAKCVEVQFKGDTLFKPPYTPFFTSFEFTFKPA